MTACAILISAVYTLIIDVGVLLEEIKELSATSVGTLNRIEEVLGEILHALQSELYDIRSDIGNLYDCKSPTRGIIEIAGEVPVVGTFHTDNLLIGDPCA